MLREFSLKYRIHTDSQAVDAVHLAIRNALLSGEAIIKIIHGYGSEGVGGSNKSAVHQLLTELMNTGKIRAFHPGEKLSTGILSSLSRRFNGHKQAFERLRRDCGNEGITLIILK